MGRRNKENYVSSLYAPKAIENLWSHFFDAKLIYKKQIRSTEHLLNTWIKHFFKS